MSREQQVKLNFTITWLFRLVTGGLVSVVLYFVVDIHTEFKQYTQRTHRLEERTAVIETTLNYLTKK